MPWITKNKPLLIGALSFLLLLALLLFYFGFGNGESFNKNKTFRVGRDQNLYATTLLGKEKNLSAFINDLIYTVAKDSGLKVQVIELPSYMLSEKLDNHEIDAILSTAPLNASNRFFYLFSNPLFETGPVLVVKENSALKTLDDFQGKHIGIKRDDSLLVDQSASVLFVPYDTYLEALEDLDRNWIEAVLLPATAAYTYTQVFYPGKLKVATDPLREEGLRLQATKSIDNHYFIETFNKGLEKAHESGFYDEALIKWGLINPRKKKVEEEKPPV